MLERLLLIVLLCLWILTLWMHGCYLLAHAEVLVSLACLEVTRVKVVPGC